MPYLSITTNRVIEDKQQTAMECSATIAEIIGKPENYVMVSVVDQQTMSFAGSTSPCAYVEFKSIGLPQDRTTEISAKICSLIEKTVDVPQDRIYIEFSNAERSMWGWDGRTF